MRYDPAVIEPKWQQLWEERQPFRAPTDPAALAAKPKYYILDMFPYPSGAGLHVGHPEGYTATDILARCKRMQGFNVLHPMGWDAFGLPAEHAAMRENIHPAVITQRNIDNFRRQLKRLGFSYDWEREVDTSDPDYYRWTQWIFLQLYERGPRATVAEMPVNWCPALGTVLANEEVKDGKLRRDRRSGRAPHRCGSGCCGSPPTPSACSTTSTASTGPRRQGDAAQLDRQVGGRRGRPSRVAGPAIATFAGLHDAARHALRRDLLVLAPEHPLVGRRSPAPRSARPSMRYVAAAARKSDVDADRAADEEDRRLHRRVRAASRSTASDVPIWIADYVLMSYGTGAIMAVPAHDERDHEFAEQLRAADPRSRRRRRGDRYRRRPTPATGGS